jgi:hypothetical protein
MLPLKYIAFSLYGQQRMYCQGMIENAKLAPTIYPGWTVIVYCAPNVPSSVIDELARLNCVIVRQPSNPRNDFDGMFWRTQILYDKTIDRAIFRDADSRLNVREAGAVHAWMESGLAAHVMHDHPHHGGRLILGGMWGIVGDFIPKEWLDDMTKIYMNPRPGKGEDTRLISWYLYPLIEDVVLTHSSIRLANTAIETRPFPKHAPFKGFVGQQIDNNLKPIWAGLSPVTRVGGERP